MSIGSVYVALLAFPAVILLIPEPLDLLWGVRHGSAGRAPPPLPPELRRRSRRNTYYLMFFRYGLLCALLYALMRWNSVSPGMVGVESRGWVRLSAIGVLVGAGLAAYWTLDRRLRWRRGGGAPPGQADSWADRTILQMMSLYAVSSFAEELWRAFCLVGLMGLAHGKLFAVVSTSLAHALAHYDGKGSPARKFGFLCGQATSAAYLAFFFLWFHSLLVTYVAHLLFNTRALYRARKQVARAAHP